MEGEGRGEAIIGVRACNTRADRVNLRGNLRRREDYAHAGEISSIHEL